MRPALGTSLPIRPRLGNSTARYHGCHPARDHLAIDSALGTPGSGDDTAD